MCVYLLAADPSFGVFRTSGSVHAHAYVVTCVCVCLHRRAAETMSQTVSPTGVSSEHMAGTFQTLRKACRVEAKPQWRVVPQSLNSTVVGVGEGEMGLHHYSIHLLRARLSAHKPVLLHDVFMQLSGHPSKTQRGVKKADIWSRSRPQRFISSERGIPVFTFISIIFMAKACH